MLSGTNDWAKDFAGFFGGGVDVGTVVDLGKGAKVTKMGDGTAVYQDALGANISFDQSANPMSLGRQAPGLQEHWNKNYSQSTASPAGGPTERADPASLGFKVNEDGTVTRKGVNPNVAAGEMGGDYSTQRSLNEVKDPEARAFYQANPDFFFAASEVVKPEDLDDYYLRYWYGENEGNLRKPGLNTYGVSGSGSQLGVGDNTLSAIESGGEGLPNNYNTLYGSLYGLPPEFDNGQRPAGGTVSRAPRTAIGASSGGGLAPGDNTMSGDPSGVGRGATGASGANQSSSQFQQDLAYRYDALKLGRESRAEAEKRAHANALEIQSNAAMNAQYETYLRRLAEIDNSDYDAETKVRMKNAAGRDFDTFAASQNPSWDQR